MLPTSTDLRPLDVACPIPPPGGPHPYSRIPHPGYLEQSHQHTHKGDEEGHRKSRVRKMGVFLAGAAAASAAGFSYGEIRKRSIMEQDSVPPVEESSSHSLLNRLLNHPLPSVSAECEKPQDHFGDDSSNATGREKGLTRRQRFNFIAEVVEETAASLVYIEIKDMGVRDYFSGEALTSSNGSGFIIEPDGLILTNAHVVVNKPRAKVQVRLQDGRTFQGHVEDVDVRSDLATVRISARELPVMRLGRSSSVRPGEFVIAMGSPLSLSNTITTGVVSSASRHRSELGLRGRDVPEYLQTDAAITFGNSGGPLINLDGEAIGINSMKVTPGISFAIPIDYAKEFLQKSRDAKSDSDDEGGVGGRGQPSSQKKSGGGIPPHRRYMGLTMLAVNEQVIDELRLKLHIPSLVKHGVLVFKILDGSPADVAGVKPGDIVTHINGSPIRGVADVYKFLEGRENLRLTIIRKNQEINVVVTPEL